MILYTAANPKRVEWLFNLRRWMARMNQADLQHIAVGTTSNETLHRELNRVFDNVHTMHQATLRLKLRIFHLYKLLPHNRAMYRGMVRQASQKMVVHRTVAALELCSKAQWKTWCGASIAEGHVVKANLPLWQARQTQAQQCKAWVARKRPAAAVSNPVAAAAKRAVAKRPAAMVAAVAIAKRPAGVVKRTPFTRLTGIRLLQRSRHGM